MIANLHIPFYSLSNIRICIHCRGWVTFFQLLVLAASVAIHLCTVLLIILGTVQYYGFLAIII